MDALRQLETSWLFHYACDNEEAAAADGRDIERLRIANLEAQNEHARVFLELGSLKKLWVKPLLSRRV